MDTLCPELAELLLPPAMKPVRWDDDEVPVFDSNQVELYGLPEYYGVYKYRVIALRETESPMVTDWKMQMERPMVSACKKFIKIVETYSQVQPGRKVYQCPRATYCLQR